MIGRNVKRCKFFALLSFVPLLAAADSPHADLPNFQYDAVDRTTPAELFDGPNDYDPDVVSHGDSLWYAWLEFSPGKGDRIFVGERRGREIIRTPVVQFGAYAHPTLTVDAQQQLWLSYECERDQQWDVMAAPLERGRLAAEPIVVSTSQGADINHRVAADADGRLWVAWQSDQDAKFSVVVRPVFQDSLGDVEVVGRGPGGQWRPAVAVGSDEVHVVWDGYNGESFDVYHRSRSGRSWGPVNALADSPAFEGRADVAVDGRGRVWAAWEEGAVNWGRAYRGIDTMAMGDASGPLHRFRLIRAAVKDPTGAWRSLDGPPMPSIAAAESRQLKNAQVMRTGAFYERPKLQADSADRIWLAYRHYYTPWLGVEHRSHVEQGWGVFARYLHAEGWSPPMRFEHDQGDGMQRLELTAHGEGVAAAWTVGRTHREPASRSRGIATAAVPGQGSAADPASLVSPASASPTDGSVKRRTSHTIESGGTTYQLFFGDLHRHTDLSLCRVPFDGTIEDAYRYAIEVSQLDFLGITDHSRDIALGDPLSQLWWRSRKEVYRHQLPSRFLPFYAYERSHGNTADHNVISLRADMLRPHTYPVPQFWQELDHDTMTIPHQPIRRDTWKYQDDALRPLVEIYQGCRDESIEEDVHRGLEHGYHLGFIASSDHLSTSASYAGVWAEQPTRESIFRALQARRTFAATANIALSVRAGEHWMGQQLEQSAWPPIDVEVEGTAPIRWIKMVVDGQVAKTFVPEQRENAWQVRAEVEAGRYVYFHVGQSDGNQAWSSPIWVASESPAKPTGVEVRED